MSTKKCTLQLATWQHAVERVLHTFGAAWYGSVPCPPGVQGAHEDCLHNLLTLARRVWRALEMQKSTGGLRPLQKKTKYYGPMGGGGVVQSLIPLLKGTKCTPPPPPRPANNKILKKMRSKQECSMDTPLGT